MTKLSTSVNELSAALNEHHYERAEEVEISLTALMSGFHVVLVGPPGTGKSMLARDLCSSIVGAKYFEILMSKFTNPDETAGPVSIQGLKQGIYRRELDGMVPEAHIAFFDEVFKANSAILNSMLMLMNERKFKNGKDIVAAPLISLFGASNELPEGEELGALFDRFQFRKRVDYIMDPSKFMQMLTSEEKYDLPKLTLDELAEAQAEVREVQATDATLDSIYNIRADLNQEGVFVSDRRFRQSLKALKAMAWQAERETIYDDDFRILQHMYWTNPQDIKKVQRVVLTHTNPLDLEATKIADDIDNIAGELSAALLNKRQKDQTKDSLTQKGIEWFTRCRTMSSELTKLEKKAIAAGKSTIMIERTKDRLFRLTRQVGAETMGLDVEKDKK